MFDQYVDEDQGTLELVNKAHLNIQELIVHLQRRKDITCLHLNNCNIGNEDVKALAESNLTNLTWLDLSSNKITEEKQDDPDMSTWSAVKSSLSDIFTTKHNTELHLQ